MFTDRKKEPLQLDASKIKPHLNKRQLPAHVRAKLPKRPAKKEISIAMKLFKPILLAGFSSTLLGAAALAQPAPSPSFVRNPGALSDHVYNAFPNGVYAAIAGSASPAFYKGELGACPAADGLNEVASSRAGGMPAGCFYRISGGPGGDLITVKTMAELKALPVAVADNTGVVFLLGYYTPGDFGEAVPYVPSTSPCTLNSGNGDDGSQAEAPGGNCWIAAFSNPTVLNWGAIADDDTDVMPYIVAAWAANTGKCINIPAGTWRVRTGGVFRLGGPDNPIPPPCFYGEGFYSQVVTSDPTATPYVHAGTWLHLSDPTVTMFTIVGSASGVHWRNNPNFSKMAFIVDHAPPVDPSWTPTNYPPIFELGGGANDEIYDLTFRDLHFHNTTGCIRSRLVGRLNIGTITGQPMGTCLDFDRMHDVTTIERAHFWPFWTNNQYVRQYQFFNVDPIVLGRVDGFNFQSYFTLATRSGIKFVNNGNGVVLGGHFGLMYPDNNLVGIHIDANGVSATFDSVYFGNPGVVPFGGGIWDDESAAILIQGSSNRIQIGKSIVSRLGCEYYRDEGAAGPVSYNILQIGTWWGGFIADGAPPTSPFWDMSGTGCSLFKIVQTSNHLTAGAIKISEFSPWTRACYDAACPAGGMVFLPPAHLGNGRYEIVGLKHKFSPELLFAAGTGWTYTTQEGSWELKPGGRLEVSFHVTLSNLGTASGIATIGTLPYLCAGGNTYGSLGSLSRQTSMTGLPGLIMPSNNGGSVIALYEPSATGIAAITAARFTATSDLGGKLNCELAWRPW